MAPQILEGTWEELSARADEFPRSKRLVLIVPGDEPPTVDSLPRSSSAEERIAALNALAERNRHLPILSADAFERESLYDESS
jgi:hypothetical protein